MCVMSTPKVETPAPAPTVETIGTAENQAAARQSAQRRRRNAFGRAAAFGGGMMNSAEAAGKTKLGQ